MLRCLIRDDSSRNANRIVLQSATNWVVIGFPTGFSTTIHNNIPLASRRATKASPRAFSRGIRRAKTTIKYTHCKCSRIYVYILNYTSHRHNISQQAPPRGTSARNCVSYFIIILISPQWFMASLYANIILSHSSGAATAAAPLAFFREKKYTYYICIQITCVEKKQHRPRTVTRTNTRACI